MERTPSLINFPFDSNSYALEFFPALSQEPSLALSWHRTWVSACGDSPCPGSTLGAKLEVEKWCIKSCHSTVERWKWLGLSGSGWGDEKWRNRIRSLKMLAVETADRLLVRWQRKSGVDSSFGLSLSVKIHVNPLRMFVCLFFLTFPKDNPWGAIIYNILNCNIYLPAWNAIPIHPSPSLTSI